MKLVILQLWILILVQGEVETYSFLGAGCVHLHILNLLVKLLLRIYGGYIQELKQQQQMG